MTRRCRSELKTTDAYGCVAWCELEPGHAGDHQAWMHGLGKVKSWPRKRRKVDLATDGASEG